MASGRNRLSRRAFVKTMKSKSKTKKKIAKKAVKIVAKEVTIKKHAAKPGASPAKKDFEAFTLNQDRPIIFVNDKWLAKRDAMVSVYDHGILYGDGVFEGIRIYNG